MNSSSAESSGKATLPRIITVDGLPGVGKTTQAELIANRLGYANLTPGMLFCAGGLALAGSQVSPSNPLEQLAVLRDARITFELTQGAKPSVAISGRDVSEQVFLHKGQGTHLNMLPGIAEHFENRLRALTVTGRWVVDRGARLYPDADLKFWLTATPEVRAARRCGQLAMQGEYVQFDQVRREQAERTVRDRQLFRVAEDVHVIDTTRLEAEETYAELAHIITSQDE
jgi:cytidylate kinase